MPASNINVINIEEPDGKDLFNSGYCEIAIFPDGMKTLAMDGKTSRGAGNTSCIKWYLPMPKGFNDIYDNEWTTLNLDTVSGEGSKGVAAVVQGMKEGRSFGDLVGTAAESISLVGAATGAALGAVQKFAPGVADIFSYATGLIVNPYTSLVYKSPTLRQFNFSWSLISVSAQKAKQIEKFVSDLRSYSYPDLTSVTINPGMGTTPYDLGLMKYPANFRITIKTKSDKVLLATLPAVCTSIQINYDTEGNPYVHNDGQPLTTNVTLQIQEAKLMDRTSASQIYDKNIQLS